MPRTTTTNRAIAMLGVAFWVIFGLWAFVHPPSFFERVADYPPLNVHFLRDAGAFQLGLGAGLAAALVWRDALAAALVGTAVGAVFHVAAHVIDRDQGGSLGDTLGLAVLAAAFVYAAVQQVRRAET